MRTASAKRCPRWAHPRAAQRPVGEAIESLADGLAGKGKQINTSLNSLSTALTALNESRGETFAVLRGLATFLNALNINEQQLAALNEPGADHFQLDQYRPGARRRDRGTPPLLASAGHVPDHDGQAGPRRQQSLRGDHPVSATRHRQRLGDLIARLPDIRRQQPTMPITPATAA